jgi:SAM-dependent methyltransferase
MANYTQFAPFYDAVMGDRKEATGFLLSLVREYHPNARKVLELACGTGSVLQHFGKRYELYGVDLSSNMLAVARKKVPRAILSCQNMVSFRLQQRFDVIFCVYDSINHVLSFSDWKRTLANAHKHLAQPGIFIFDINTQKKLARHIAEPAWFHPFGANFLVIKVSDAGGRVSNWNIKVFEHSKRNQYLLHEEDIKEVSFPKERIIRAVRSRFSGVNVIDPDRDQPEKKGERLYFVCKKLDR